jgi:3-phenylpropionate/cinnamic acid dioxygenase small subunit
MSDRDRVIDRINDLFIATDDRDWPRVRACFTPEIEFDMSSASGQPAARIASADVVAGWETGLAALDAIHHQAGNYRVDVRGGEATAFCYGIAYHYRRNESGRNTRTFVGSYDFHLVRDGEEWRIDAFRFNLKFIDGNPDL